MRENCYSDTVQLVRYTSAYIFWPSGKNAVVLRGIDSWLSTFVAVKLSWSRSVPRDRFEVLRPST